MVQERPWKYWTNGKRPTPGPSHWLVEPNRSWFPQRPYILKVKILSLSGSFWDPTFWNHDSGPFRVYLSSSTTRTLTHRVKRKYGWDRWGSSEPCPSLGHTEPRNCRTPDRRSVDRGQEEGLRVDYGRSETSRPYQGNTPWDTPA